MERTRQDEVVHLLKVIHIRIEELLNSLTEQYDLTAAQCDVLGFILAHEEEGINSTMLCQQMYMSKANISVLLKKLRQKNYLQFKINPKDDRQKQIVVTEKTKELEKILRANFYQMEKHLFENISDEELNFTNEIMKKLLFNLQKEHGRSSVW